MKRGCADDLATLLELDPMIILDEVHARYKQDIIYVSCHEELSLSVLILLATYNISFLSVNIYVRQTYVGDILIALNPFKRLDIYNKNVSVNENLC